jgi:DNA-binding NarL/FixJ family response regulator
MKSRPVIILAEHRICGEAFRCLLEPEFTVFVVDNGDLVHAAHAHKAQVIVMEVLLPSLDGLQAIRDLKKADPEVKIVVFSAYSEPQYVTTALRAGASAYVFKSQTPSELIKAIRSALDGGKYMPRRHERRLRPDCLGAMLQGALTGREREVLQLIAEGSTAKEIAGTLKISARTAEFHKYRIMDKLKLRTVAALTRYAINHELL